MTAINFPYYKRIIGTNVTFVEPTTGGVNSWGPMWTNFAARWVTEYKPQIDLTYALGGNCVRIIGDLSWITGGGISQATYNGHWQTLLEYTGTLGDMYVYPCATGCYQFGASGVTNTQAITAINSWLAAIDQYKNRIIGIDLMNEVSHWYGFETDPNGLVRAQAILNGVKDGGTTLPLTYSTFEVMGGACAYDTLTGWDYLDFHIYKMVYGSMPTNAQVNSALARYPGYELLIGEFGDPNTSGEASNTEMATWGWGVAKNLGRRVRGALQWAVADQDNDNKWGIHDASYVARAWYATAMQKAAERRSMIGGAAAGLPVFGS